MKKIPKLMMILSAFLSMANGHKSLDSTNHDYIKYNKQRFSTYKPETIARWTGTLTYELISIFSNEVYNGKVEKKIQVSFKNALPRKYREDQDDDTAFTDYKGTGTYQIHGDIIESFTNRRCVSDCQGSGIAELHSVVIREWDNTYDIEAIGPVCHMTGNCSDPYEDGDNVITVSNHHLTDKNVLTGTETVTGEMPGRVGTYTRTTSWNLRREKEDNDVELIVTPVNYDTWLPEPGRNELSKGNVMTIKLELIGKNGKPLKVKAETFELHLFNTSKEPGITINYPLEPDQNQLPDLRFIHLPNIESVDEDQTIIVGSPDGKTGTAYLGSYDGGGWTVLKAEAILDDDNKTRVQGRLLNPGGEIDIRIPKRDPNSHIGEVWSKANGNPTESEDKESSKDNPYDGDGLTAYEEYRGIISKAYQLYSGRKRDFSRLSPKKKELGIRIKKEEFELFKEGFKWFENASPVAIIPFYENEIDLDRRLNKNFKTAHTYDQFAIIIKKGNLARALGKTYPDTGIPANIQMIVIDSLICMAEYGYWQVYAKEIGMKIPYTKKELIAKTVAHEIGHAVAVMHHGSSHKTTNGADAQKTFDDAGAKYLIMSTDGIPISLPYKIIGLVGGQGNEESGDLSCTMVYQPYCKWALGIKNGLPCFTGVRIYPLGNTMCILQDGKFINQKDSQGNNDYFGDAMYGNCLSRIKLKN